jgi:hypothetical protein
MSEFSEAAAVDENDVMVIHGWPQLPVVILMETCLMGRP